jgi:hypothetical protein
MPASHVCPRCGHELGATRAVLDPVYALPVVVCPCGFACVRRRDPLVAAFRKARRIAIAFELLLIRGIAVFLLAAGAASLILIVQHALREERLDLQDLITHAFGLGAPKAALTEWWHQNGLVQIAIWLLISVVSGLWLRATLTHWRAGPLLLAWCLLLLFFLLADVWSWPFTAARLWHNRDPIIYNGPGLSESLARVGAAGATIALTALAMPFGQAMRPLSSWYRARWLSKRRAKLKRLRESR